MIQSYLSWHQTWFKIQNYEKTFNVILRDSKLEEEEEVEK